MRALLLTTTVATALLAAGLPAHASLIGQGFNVSYRYADLGTVYGGATASPADFVVGAGVESVVDVEGVTDLIVDLAASSLTVLFDTVLTSPTWNAASFNGLLFIGTAAHGIAGATVDASSTLGGFGDSRIGLTGDQIGLDWNGLSYVDGTRLVINFTFNAVPEPAALALFGGGLLGMAMARRRGRVLR
jgi:hypothetical protein